MHYSSAVTTISALRRSNIRCNGPLQPGTGSLSACNDENTAKHAPLQRNNEAGVFCNIAEWIILHPGCMAMDYCRDAFVHLIQTIGIRVHTMMDALSGVTEFAVQTP